ncbi:MAG: hypothetical protein C4547_16215 [Phycisphaerales bacterium]|nr:MAG: hypothetical protein C4547_16215 [Phycisphaerales bacterium]
MLRRFIPLLFGLLLICAGGVVALAWTTCRIAVPEDMCAVLTRKMGAALPEGQNIATEPGQKGIQEAVLGPGRHWRIPLWWDWRLVPLTVIPSGDPNTWNWKPSLDDAQIEALKHKELTFRGEFPRIGVVTRKVGPDSESVIVERGSKQKGIWREVLTPGVYKINPEIYDVQLFPATVIPAGFVGVVTNMFGDTPAGYRVIAAGSAAEAGSPAPAEPAAPMEGDDAQDDDGPAGDAPQLRLAQPLAEPGERGVLRDVLQPGVYFINPKLQKVTLVEIGYNEFSQTEFADEESLSISFPSDTGYTIRVGVTVIWGIHPRHAAEIINDFGNIDRVLAKIIGPQLRSICRNIGSTYSARDFIQGEKRELFQRDLTAELRRVCNQKNVEVLLALVREIEVIAPHAAPGEGEVTEDLKRTIQQSYIAIENQITKEKQREAAAVRAKLEEERKKIEIVRETIKAQTRVMVADIDAEAQKDAAQIDAQAELEVATVQQQVAELDAQRVEILGRARTDVEKMKKSAEAEGYRLLVDAFGSPAAYNLYTFAQNFQPESIRLFFAGEGTFWTDLSRLEDAGAARLLDPRAEGRP